MMVLDNNCGSKELFPAALFIGNRSQSRLEQQQHGDHRLLTQSIGSMYSLLSYQMGIEVSHDFELQLQTGFYLDYPARSIGSIYYLLPYPIGTEVSHDFELQLQTGFYLDYPARPIGSIYSLLPRQMGIEVSHDFELQQH